MIRHHRNQWAILGGALVVAGVACMIVWRHRDILPQIKQARLRFFVQSPNVHTNTLDMPYTTQLVVTVKQWPHAYNTARNQVLLIVTTTTTRVRQVWSRPVLTEGGSTALTMNRPLIRLGLQPTLQPNSPISTWFFINRAPLTDVITAFTSKPVPPAAWRLALQAQGLSGKSSLLHVLWTKVVIPSQ